VLVFQRANITDFFPNFCVRPLKNAKLKVFFKDSCAAKGFKAVSDHQAALFHAAFSFKTGSSWRHAPF
jgi:hypothetical protein